MTRRKLLTLTVAVCLTVVLAFLSLMSACPSPAPESPTPQSPTPQTPTPQPSAPEVKTLQIGANMSLSGWFSGGDMLQMQGLELARDMINERGGIDIEGQKYLIELVVEDNKSTGDGTAAACTKLVHDQNIKFMVGASAFMAAAAAPICEPAKVLRSLGFTTLQPGEFGTDTPYTFLCHAAVIEQSLTVIKYLAQAYPEVKTVTYLQTDDGSDYLVVPRVRDMLAEIGVSIVGDPILINPELVDYSPVAAKLNAANTDAVMLGSVMPPHMGSVLKSLREMGNNKLIFCMAAGSSADIIAVSGEAAATNWFNIGYIPGSPGTPPLTAEYGERLISEYGQVSPLHFHNATGLWCMVEAIKAAQSLDTTVIKETWENMDTIESLWGTGHMGGLETYGLRHVVVHPLPVQVIEDGQARHGAWIEYEVP